MLKRILGVVMIADGAMFAAAISTEMSTFVYRNLTDQSLLVAHVVVGMALAVGGRLVMTGDRRAVAVTALLAACGVVAGETTALTWVPLAARGLYTIGAIAVLTRSTTLPTT